MKKRINELLNGTFEYHREKPQLSESHLEGATPAGENYSGRFTVKAPDARPLHGFLYSTNARVGYRPESFAGSLQEIRFEADVQGLSAGDVLKGEFVLSSSAGEVRLPYEIRVGRAEDAAKEQDAADVLTREAFVQQAQEDFSAAYVRFLSPEFRRAVGNWGGTAQLLYENLTRSKVSYHALEQFLVGIGAKEPVRLSLKEEQIRLSDIRETRKEELVLSKSTWGFSTVTIQSDAAFLEIERPNLTTDEFVGSTCHAGYVIRREKMHAGINFARVTVRCGYDEQTCVIAASTAGLHRSKPLHGQKQERLQLLNDWIRFRTGELLSGEWAEMTLHSIENYRHMGGNHIFYDLLEAYALMEKQDLLQAEVKLEQLQGEKARLQDPVWQGGYLYLTTLQECSDEYRTYAADQLRELFLENQESWMMQWLMFRMNGQMIRNDTEKLELIRRQFLYGCHSPVMYLEAYEILKKEPLMLRRLEPFEVRLLAFICREGLLDRELSGQIAQLAGRCQKYDPVLFRILQTCFKEYPTKNVLTAICSLLIQGRKREPRYAFWYAMGVKTDVRITGLYEYYVETMQEMPKGRLLPQSVRLYFVYHNTLDYHRKAAIYANIIRNRDCDEETYVTYRESMTLFMEEQLAQGRVSRDLALLYETLLTPEIMTEQLAAGLEKVLYTREAVCEQPGIRQLTVLHLALGKEQQVTVTNGRAYVQIYNENYCLLARDERGTLYAGAPLVRLERLLQGEVYENYCREYLEHPVGLLLQDSVLQTGDISVQPENVLSYIRLLGRREVKGSYRLEIRRHLMDYFAEHPQDPLLERFASQIRMTETAQTQMRQTAVILSTLDRYPELLELVRIYGMEKVDTEILVRMCSACISEQTDDAEADPMLLAVCAYCFCHKLYEETMLSYLMRHFEGPLEMMKAIWYAARDFKLTSFAFEEKILVLLLFLGEGEEQTEPIFDAYRRKLGKSRICRAYATRMAYRYFVQEKETTSQVFDYIERDMLGVVGTPDVCRLALLQYFVRKKEKTAGQQQWMLYLLEKYLDQGMRFAFLTELPRRIREQYHLQDKVIVEYRTAPGSDVLLRYTLNGQKEQSVMLPDVFEGIYTKEFTLFYKDQLEWSFTSGEEKKAGQKKYYIQAERPAANSGTRYDLINQMIDACENGQTQRYQSIRARYAQQKLVAEEWFGLN